MDRRLLLALLLLPLPAAAQSAPGAETMPGRSVYQPGAGVADGASPFSLVLNPAGLAELRGFNLGLRDTETPGDAAFSGRGTGLYAAAPLPYLSFAQAGAALELLRPPADPVPLAGKLTLALAVQPLPVLSLGLSYAHLFYADRAREFDTVSLGLRLRAGPWLALGATAFDLNAPLSGTIALRRSYEGELLLRPLADERLELGLGARVDEAAVQTAPRLRLWARPRRGLGLGAEGTLLLAQGGGIAAWRAGLGLSIDFAFAGGSAFGLAAGGPGSAGFGAASVAVRASVERYPSIVQGSPGHLTLVRIEPGKAEGVDFLRVLALLRALERDRGAGGVIAVLGSLEVGWARAGELRDAFSRLRRAGKHVFVYGADLDTRAYYAATAAERIFLDPVGSLRVLGASTTGWYVKEALDAIGVRAEILHVGEYKSAPETFTSTGPSAPARAQREALVEAQAARLQAALQEGRGLLPAQAAAAIARGVYTPAAARAARLVDAVATGDEVEAALQRDLGGHVRVITPPPASRLRPRSWAPPAIAVINVEGDLFAGTSRTVPLVGIKIAGGETIARALARADRDPRVQAVVVRIESPGGSAQVADLIARQVQQVREHKPVVCSFGDAAASGGYYLAAPCSEILADPLSVTGSIGIFGGKVDASGLLERLGIHPVVWKRGDHADIAAPWRAYTAEERELAEDELRGGYERFLAVVARGRGMTPAQVDAVGRGRVWLGQDAVRLRLCDRLGGLADAIAAARQRAGLGEDEDAELMFFPPGEPGLLGQLLGWLGIHVPGQAALPGAKALRDLLIGLPAALLLLDHQSLALLEGEVPR